MMRAYAIFALTCLLLSPTRAVASNIFEKDADGNFHVNVPFVNVETQVGPDGQRHVQVRAPFVNVDNAGTGNVQVRAPLVNVGTATPGNVQVRAPFVNVGNPGMSTMDRIRSMPPVNSSRDLKIDAPFAHIQQDQSGATHIETPLTTVNPGGGPVRVDAPFARVEQLPDGTTRVNAPFTDLTSPADGTQVHVNAPFAKIEHNKNGSTKIKAPFTNIDTK